MRCNMPKKWLVKDIDSASADALSSCLGLLRATSLILTCRGIATPEDARTFLSPSLSTMPDPFLLKGMEAAVSRLLEARSRQETVCIYGDYDVDGISGTALLVSFLRTVGLNCKYFIPNRFDDGYGLNLDSLERIIASGVSLIVSVDCGITSVQEAEYCSQQKVDLIIVDHHTPKEVIPDACAVINPLQPGCSYPFKYPAGVGVAFNLLIALRSRLRKSGGFDEMAAEPDLREWLDLVALGTIADVVPLTGQNRVYTYYGLQRLSSSGRTGLQALKEVAGIKGAVTCGQVGFRLAPRLNAAGRMESAVPGVELLLGSDAQEAAAIADELDAANSERQAIERRMLEEAIQMVEKDCDYPACRSIVLASAAWHQGVAGIVASRIAERYYRPTILIAIDEQGKAKGSGRSIPGFHLLEALHDCSEHLERFGGHQYAAGVSLSADRFEAFAASFEESAARIFGASVLVPLLEIDAELRPAEISKALTAELKRLEPFGAGNPEPTLLMRGLKVVERRMVGDGHLKLRLSAEGCTFNAIAFRQSNVVTDGLIDIAFFPEINVWNNSETVQLRIKEIRQAEE
ncbi:MAG: single-stranded-DNA-specific exonuclease RecJ [Deltaproteobacteria bacterium]|nr:single-stranded-DNA-specific exonuclease RecJ [Deltaproteobacteria bacterium]